MRRHAWGLALAVAGAVTVAAGSALPWLDVVPGFRWSLWERSPATAAVLAGLCTATALAVALEVLRPHEAQRLLILACSVAASVIGAATAIEHLAASVADDGIGPAVVLAGAALGVAGCALLALSSGSWRHVAAATAVTAALLVVSLAVMNVTGHPEIQVIR